MTRYARAKGSKASNERVPNEATPWHVMKQQLEDTESTKKCQPNKAKSAKQLLKENDDAFYFETTGNVKNDWAEFQVPAIEKNKSIKKCKEEFDTISTKNGSFSVEDLTVVDSTSKKKSKKTKSNPPTEKSVESLIESTETLEVVCKEKKKKKKSESSQEIKTCHVQDGVANDSKISLNKKAKKRKVATCIEDTAEPKAEQFEKVELPKKKKKKNKTDSALAESLDIKNAIKEKHEDVPENPEKNATGVKMSKRQKRNLKHKNKNANNEAGGPCNEKAGAVISNGFDATGNDWENNVNFGKRNIQKSPDVSVSKVAPQFKKPLNNFNKQQANDTMKKKAPKIRDGGVSKRRKADWGSMKCIINGVELEIVKYDGFPVKKEDAERLTELKQNMIMKGIPKADIDRAMKLERRRAEKALARVRKEVCFNCRKTGHNLSECPELGKEESATGICFKCGSTEHTHFECKVTKKEEFRYASCFICREQGHIAKQCPDNPKGLYPKGGACKICGDVTHLKKDCPDLSKEKEENTVTLNTITNNKLESLDEDVTSKNVQNDDTKSKSCKVVKF